MRKWVSWLHRYVGLALCALLALSGGTGAVLVFSGEIDAALHPSLRRVEPQPGSLNIDNLAARAREAWPQNPIRMITVPEDTRGAAEVWYRDSGMRAYVDPYSGQFLGLRDTHDSLVGMLSDLHIYLLSGDTGKNIIGWVGLTTLGLIVLGFWLWWPKRGRWQQAFKIKWDASAVRIWLDLHKLAGVLAGIFILLIAATGGALALSDAVTEPLFIALTGEGAKKPAPVSSRNTGAPASLDAMALQALTTFPAGRITRIMLPTNPQGAVAVRMQLPGEIHQLGRTFVYFDQYDGRLLRADNALQANLATRINSWFYPLHTGVYGGIASRLLHVAVGISLTLLAFSGCWIWARNRLAKKRADARKRVMARAANTVN